MINYSILESDARLRALEREASTGNPDAERQLHRERLRADPDYLHSLGRQYADNSLYLINLRADRDRAALEASVGRRSDVEKQELAEKSRKLLSTAREAANKSHEEFVKATKANGLNPGLFVSSPGRSSPSAAICRRA